jgi:tetratricopeptide (TPR) repeat protein
MIRAEMFRACLCILAVSIVISGCGPIGHWRGQKYFRQASVKFERGEYGAAEDLYGRAVKADPSLSEAWFLRGISNAKLGDVASARGNYLRALRVNPDHEGAAVALCDLDLLIYATAPSRFEELYDEAQRFTSRLLKRHPNSFDGWRLMAVMAKSSGDDARAIEYYDKALRTGRATPSAVLDAVGVLFHARRGDQAVGLAESLITKVPTFGPVYDVLAFVYMQTGQTGKAEEILSRKVHNNPGNFEYLIQLAELYRNTARPGAEAAILGGISKASSQVPAAHLLLGDYYSRTGRGDQAISEYEAGAKVLKGPELAACQSKAAILLMGRGRNREAGVFAAELRKAKPEDPDSQALYLAVKLPDADAAELQDLIRGAEAYIARTRGLETRKVQAQLARAYSARAEVETGYRQLQQGDNMGARHAGEAMIRDQTAAFEGSVILAKALNRLGQPDAARDTLAGLIRRYPEKTDVHYQLGLVLLGTGDYEEAAREFKAAMVLGDERATTGLARCKSAQGQPEEAVQLLKEAVRLKPDSVQARSALASAYRAEGRFGDAVSVLAPLVDKGRPVCELYVQSGESKWLAGDHAAAIQMLVNAEPVCSGNDSAAPALAEFQALAGRTENAIRTYWSILNRRPDDENAMKRVAELELESGTDLLHAASMAERLYRRHPDDPGTIELYERVCLKNGNTVKALELAQELLRHAPRKPEYRLRHAVALYNSGHRIESERELEKLLKDAPSSMKPEIEKTLYATRGANPIAP